MRRFILLSIFCLSVVGLASCSHQDSMTGPGIPIAPAKNQWIDPELAAGEIIQTSGWEFAQEVELPAKLDLLSKKGIYCRILDFDREPLVNGVVHYTYVVAVGPGEYDRIRLHRVVKERRPYRPIRTRRSVFALHGNPGNFNQYFLIGAVAPSAPDDHAMAIYLAENDVDVWGIDQAYNLVPPETTDFSFMADWGMQTDVDNLRTGLAVARFTRLFTGSGFGQMILIGFGSAGGGITGYAALNHETQLPRIFRHIGAFVPLEAVFKTDSEAWRAYYCAAAANYANKLAGGIYEDAQGKFFKTAASLALHDPDGDSPIVPGFTNRGAFLFLVAMTWVPSQFPDQSHYLGGVFDSGVPVDLQYSIFEEVAEGTQQIDPFNSTLYRYEAEAIKCGVIDLPFDDFLAEITVPILAVGVGGFQGNLSEYTTTLLGSNDVTILNVSLDNNMMLDIGVLAICHATNAEFLFWQPMLEWIEAHTCHKEVDSQIAATTQSIK